MEEFTSIYTRFAAKEISEREFYRLRAEFLADDFRTLQSTLSLSPPPPLTPLDRLFSSLHCLNI